MTGRDKRSVGELLLESDHIARAVLMDVDEMDAATMLRTWGEVVQAAGDVDLRRLPLVTHSAGDAGPRSIGIARRWAPCSMSRQTFWAIR